MRGFPKWFNVRQDVLNCLEEFPAQMKAKLQDWLDNRFVWQTSGEILEGEEGITDATHRVIEEQDMGTESTRRFQQELAEDKNSHLFRVGLTVEEAEEIITRLN